MNRLNKFIKLATRPNFRYLTNIHPKLPNTSQLRQFTTFKPILEQAQSIEGKMLIGFTCKVCDHRTHKTFSKKAYTEGVVLIQCPSCESRHLIADNLGWFRDNKVNIEDLMGENGEGVKFVKGGEIEATEWVPQVVEEENQKVAQLKGKSSEAKESKE